jgi:hypothetical protein
VATIVVLRRLLVGCIARPMKTSTRLALILSSLLLCVTVSARAENLGEILERAELGALAGTWVDEDSNGEAISLTYTWRIENYVLALSVKRPNNNSEAMIAVDPKTGEVVHVTANEKGGMGRGKWAEENGVATLTLKFANLGKEEMTLKITHRIVDNKQLVVGLKNVETDEGGEMILVRKSE